jgi:hypothetical protein
MTMSVELGKFSLDRVVRAVEKVRERLLRAAGALERAGVPYAVAGGNAVALWVSRVEESAVRNTRDVDILIRRSDLDAARDALTAAGFIHRHSSGLDLFLDGPDAKARDAVHLVFANEKVRAHEELPNPNVTEAEDAGVFRVLALPALVRIKLTAFRDKDRTHLRDLIDVGLIDESWCARFPDALADRLRRLIETPEG